MLASVIVITFWTVLGSWTAVLPGTLDHSLGLGYNFKEEWGMSAAKFEAFTPGTLAVVVISVLGYLAGTKVRSDLVEVPLAPPEASEGVPTA